MKKVTALDKAKSIAQLAAEKKGEDIVLMDMRNISTMFDWFVLITASSYRRINAISQTIQKNLSKERISALHVEGKQNPYWVLLDYEDVVVHVFYKEIREFYGLEQLWSEAPIERFDNKCLAKTSRKK
ncbi:MAG: ribosome silencing factor [Candidatus Makaraimicrobium thalassicum]|nr:MAG: ribosome silencing factor [Candidatus Omnitrophota bacterium]